MIRHLLMFRWTSESKPDDRATALDALRSLDKVVPEIDQLTVEEDLGIGGPTYDGMIEVRFSDEAAFRRYVENEEHQQIWVRQLQPVWAEMASVQVPG